MIDLDTDRFPPQTRLQEAARWWVQMQDEAISQAEIARWLNWLDAHPENLPAYESVQCVSLGLAAWRRPAPRVSPRKLAIGVGMATLLWGSFICIKITGVLAPQSSLLLF